MENLGTANGANGSFAPLTVAGGNSTHQFASGAGPEISTQQADCVAMPARISGRMAIVSVLGEKEKVCLYEEGVLLHVADFSLRPNRNRCESYAIQAATAWTHGLPILREGLIKWTLLKDSPNDAQSGADPAASGEQTSFAAAAGDFPRNQPQGAFKAFHHATGKPHYAFAWTALGARIAIAEKLNVPLSEILEAVPVNDIVADMSRQCCIGTDMPGVGYQHAEDCRARLTAHALTEKMLLAPTGDDGAESDLALITENEAIVSALNRPTLLPVATVNLAPARPYRAGEVPESLYRMLRDEYVLQLIDAAQELAGAVIDGSLEMPGRSIKQRLTESFAPFHRIEEPQSECKECQMAGAQGVAIRHAKSCRAGRVLRIVGCLEDLQKAHDDYRKGEAAGADSGRTGDGIRSCDPFEAALKGGAQ